MKHSGPISLRAIAPHTRMLAVACSQCDLVAEYRLRILIFRYGAGYRVSDLLDRLSAGCPKHDLCGIHCPQLPGFFLPTT